MTAIRQWIRLLETTVKLTDLYDGRELYDETEALYHAIEPDDLERDFAVHTMTPAEAKTFLTHRDDMTVYRSFTRNAKKAQKQYVEELVANYDHDRIIVVMNKSVIDGNHHLIAGILANQPIKYIDLAEYV